MKTQLIYLFGLLTVVSLFTSCKKERPEEMQQLSGTSLFSCNVDGVPYESKGFEAYALLDEAKDATLVYGIQADGSSIYIQIPDILGEGEHLFSPQLFSFVSTGDKTFATHFVNTHSGKVNITSRTADSIAGSFEFVAYNISNDSEVIEVDSGIFNVNINR